MQFLPKKMKSDKKLSARLAEHVFTPTANRWIDVAHALHRKL